LVCLCLVSLFKNLMSIMINPAEKELLMSDCDFVFDSSLPVFKKSYSLILLDRYFIFFFFKETFKCLFVDYVLFGLQAN